MKNGIVILLLVLFSSCHSTVVVAQSKKAQEYYAQGDEALAFGKFEVALEAFENAIAIDDTYLNAYIQLANLYQNYQEDYQKAAATYEHILSLDETLLVSHYNGALCYHNAGEYDKARAHIATFLAEANLSDKGRWEGELIQSNINFAEHAIKNPVDFNPENMGAQVNSDWDEYFPAITADNQWLYFTVHNSKDRYEKEDIFGVEYQDTDWSARQKLSSKINTENYNEGAHTISVDGRYLLFASDKQSTSQGRFDIFMAKKIGTQWQAPVNLGNLINTRNWESQPMFSADGRSLYFVSKNPDGFGGSDIYVSHLVSGAFGEPENLGEVINTLGDEQRPQLHPDGNTLYFASSGHPGMGASDIFKSTKDADGNWTTPVNLGYPINTYGQELGIFVAADGEKAYISSEREGGFGGLDIYRFDLPKEAQPLAVVNVMGSVYDDESGKMMKGVIKIFDLETQKLYKVLTSDEVDGSFLITLPVGKNYAFEVDAKGYLPFSDNFSLENLENSDQFDLLAPLLPIKVGEEFVMNNIFFDTNSSELKEESSIELNQLVKFLIKNQTVKLEVGGHTDDVGSDSDNQLLSENRANAVYDYLVEKEIDVSRLTFKGYGETRPLLENDSESSRALNRRTAFKVL